MKQEMGDTVMPQHGVDQLPAVFRRADDLQILRQHVDLEHIEMNRGESASSSMGKVGLRTTERKTDGPLLARPACLVRVNANLLAPAEKIETVFPASVVVLVRDDVRQVPPPSSASVLQEEVLLSTTTFRSPPLRAS